MVDPVDKYKEDLTRYLLSVSTDAGLLKGTLFSSPDIDNAWLRYAPSFYGDAVRNFNDYPEYCLACAGYLGMAVAELWDRDWPRYEASPYSFFLGQRGFDDMDDHITGSILKESKHSVAAMQTCSSSAHHYLMRECPEPGTAQAYRMFLVTVEVMFKLGAAIRLCALGYKFEEVGAGVGK